MPEYGIKNSIFRDSSPLRATISSKSPKYSSIATGHRSNLIRFIPCYTQCFIPPAGELDTGVLSSLMRHWNQYYQSNKIEPSSFEIGLVERNERLVVFTTAKFVLERVESETHDVSLKIPRK